MAVESLIEGRLADNIPQALRKEKHPRVVSHPYIHCATNDTFFEETWEKVAKHVKRKTNCENKIT